MKQGANRTLATQHVSKARPSAVSQALSDRTVLASKRSIEPMTLTARPAPRFEPAREVVPLPLPKLSPTYEGEPLTSSLLDFDELLATSTFVEAPLEEASPRNSIDLTPRTLFAELRIVVGKLPRLPNPAREEPREEL